jgi:hypothetical protein
VNTTTGKATCAKSYTTISGSPRVIRASYGGDKGYKGSTSSVLAQTVVPAASVGVHSVTPTGKAVHDSVTCISAAGQSCPVTQTLTTTETLSHGKPVAVSAAASKKTKTLVVGTKAVTIPAGHTTTITINLTTAGRRLLKHFGKLPVILSTELTLDGHKVTVAHQKVTIRKPK